jgi:hypothetical protein
VATALSNERETSRAAGTVRLPHTSRLSSCSELSYSSEWMLTSVWLPGIGVPCRCSRIAAATKLTKGQPEAGRERRLGRAHGTYENHKEHAESGACHGNERETRPTTKQAAHVVPTRPLPHNKEREHADDGRYQNRHFEGASLQQRIGCADSFKQRLWEAASADERKNCRRKRSKRKQTQGTCE